jgi:hypothetical protein
VARGEAVSVRAAALALVTSGIRHWQCRCGYRLGVLTDAGLLVLVANALWSPERVAVRCPACRSRERFDLTALARVDATPPVA